MLETTIVNVTADNIADHPGAICFINPKHEFYHKKIEWLQEQFENGLKIQLLYLEGKKRPVGFIEYVPGEQCWRPVDVAGYLFIHCLWTNGKKYQHQGLGGELLQAVEDDAEEMRGVAVVTSKKSFMTTSDIFLKHGYRVVSEYGKEQLLVKQFRDGPLPAIHDMSGRVERYQGLTVMYSRQCPWVARFVEEMQPILTEYGLEPEIIELKTPQQAQQAPSTYGVFNLIYQGKIYADRYISTTRFKNILTKEMNLVT